MLNRGASTSLSSAGESQSSRNIWVHLTVFRWETQGHELSDSRFLCFSPNQIYFNSFVTNPDSVYHTTNAVKIAHTLKHNSWWSEGSL